MALMKPMPKKVVAFDATSQNMFYFDVPSGGSQVQANQMVIKDNITNAICYIKRINSQSYEHLYDPSDATIPLENGKSYKVCFITYDIDDNYSSTIENANYELFYCYSTPSISISNISDTITSVSFTFNIAYNQTEGEKLKSFTVRLFDDSGVEISKKETIESDVRTWYYSGFEDNKNYSIQVYGVTEYGTSIQSDKYNFFVKYIEPSLYTMLELNNDVSNGYVEVNSNLILIDGTSKEVPKYIENKKIDLTKYGDWVKWTEGFEIPSDFCLELWFELNELGTLCLLKKTDEERSDLFDVYNDYDNDYVYHTRNRALERVFGTYDNNDKYLTLSIERGTPNGSDYYDYLVLKDAQGVLRISSNFVDMLAKGSKLVAYLQKNGETYDLKLDVIDRVVSQVEWNSPTSTLAYNGASTLTFLDENPTITETYVDDYNYILDDNFFPLTTVYVKNGIFDHINIERYREGDTFPHAEDWQSEWEYRPSWGFYTILDCNFNGNIDGGNIDLVLDQVDYIHVKRREQGENEWVVIYKKKVNKMADLQIKFQDKYAPSGKTFDYAIVPINPNGSEGEYTTSQIDTCFNGVYVLDKNKIFKLYSGIAYADTTRNKLIGMIQPIGVKYPIIVENSDVDYLSGGATGKLYGYNFEKTRYVDRADVIKQTKDFSDFISDGNCKMLKDWNGNIWMVRLSQPPTTNYEQAYGNGITQVSFSWVEQGQWNNQEDLILNDFV